MREHQCTPPFSHLTLSLFFSSGYILGLGDRHSQNILVDKRTAEVIHIDLGVAFEQGKNLKTPEVVPFRLTRDVVDGMGVTGRDGVFRRCCEETVRVLRARHQALMTILEVFVHDPLMNWALSPTAALRLQKADEDSQPEYTRRRSLDAELVVATAAGSSSPPMPPPPVSPPPPPEPSSRGNKDAERALQRLKAKLQGLEYGDALSVEGQVNQLIVEAEDSSRLCQMFPGWAPWL
jgi:ataxia telangiectasia mutated family protein